ncbi:hypothetical protein LUZ60_015786 [Juncus effusus]|nr:hypothetical protein LUZ60_015786 [Juncus effusus]
MELHSPTSANKLLDYLKAVFFMLKIKTLISKKRFQMDLNLFMKRGKFMGKSVTNLLTISRHHSHTNNRELVFRNPLHLHAKRDHNKRGYFPCLNASSTEEGEEGKEADMRTPLRLEYTSQELNGITTSGASPLAVRVSDFSGLQEKEDGGDTGNVDCEAEEFIRRFYEELKEQRD